MKTFKNSLAALALCTALTAPLFSCSSDKDDEPATPAAKSVAGTYKGDMTCTVMGSESTFEDMTFILTATDDVTVNVNISAFGEAPMAVPSINVNGVMVSGADGKYSLAATEFSGTTDAGKAYSGTLQGNSADNTLTVQFNLQYGAMPMPMICSFTAPKNNR